MYSRGYIVQAPVKYPRRKRNFPFANTKEEILCSVCNIWVTGVPQYQAHVTGGKHQRKEKERAGDEVVARMPFINYNKATGLYWCCVCHVQMNSSLVALMHVSGSRHVDNMEAESNSNHKNDPAREPAPNPPPLTQQETAEREALEAVARKLTPNAAAVPPTIFECTVCQIKTNSEMQLQQHLASAKHKLRSTDPSSVPPPNPGEGLKHLHCKTCNVWVNSQTQLNQHLGSEKHKNNTLAPPIKK